MFIKQVKEQLEKMSETEKEEWILTQAKLLEENEQQSFLMSLSGEKKVIYMPSQREIEELCEKIDHGDIYLEYETHYYEFDDDGRYMDDWKVWHNDPFQAMDFLNRVFRGCHDLLLLNEYETVADILDRVCNLEFKVMESPASEDFEDDSPFTLENAAEEGMLSLSIGDIGTDWIMAYVKLADRWDSPELARRLVEIFNQPICKKLNPSMLIGEELPNDLFPHMFEILNIQILDAESNFNNLFSKTVFTHDKYLYEKKLKRQKEILLNIQMKCIDAIQKKPQQKGSVLAASWKQIGELIDALKYERYIDDQWEIEEIWNICNALSKTNKLGQEDWELRKNILSDIILHDYYNDYGCYDPMFDLSNELCVKADEFLVFADIMDASGYYKKEAAHLYHKYGRDNKYVSYLETHLGKESETYVALINYYKEHDNFDRARQVAEQALEKCKDDLTDAFIYLLVDAEKRKDKDKYKKLYSSAKRRRLADINRIDQALSDLKSGSHT
ncbi:hypothetical protein [Mahella australiensis]|nr:hypothetical protein [Mahella australiensis]